MWGQDCFAELILESSHIAAQHSLPFYLTEYNNGLGGTNRDDASGAAFLFRNVGLLESLDMWSWWTVSAAFLPLLATACPEQACRDRRSSPTCSKRAACLRSSSGPSTAP